MKRAFLNVMCAAMAFMLLMPLLFAILPADAAEAVAVGYSSPAICTDVGTKVELKNYSVQFEYGAELVPGDKITWSCGGTAVTEVTPDKKGVTALVASANGKKKNVYVVAKAAGETEYVLYEDDFSVAPDMSSFRVVQQPAGTTFSYSASEGAIVLDTSNDGANHMRVLLPEYLDDFGDAIYSARVKITNQTAKSRFGAMIFRLQDPSGKTIPYMQTAFRYDISASNGLEIAERTAADKWSVTQKGSVSGISGGSYFEVTADFCGSVSTSSVNGTKYLTEKSTPYTSGAMGLQVRGARLTVDKIKITVNPGSKVSTPAALLRDTRDPSSNIVVAPSLIAEVKTSAELAALETTLPTVAILDAELKDSAIGVSLDGKFTAIAEANVCDRVIPAYRVDSKAEAEALGVYAGSLEAVDMYVIASDDAFIGAARAKCNKLYGMLEVSKLEGDIEAFRSRVIKAGARGAILAPEDATKENVHYLEDRYLAVWQKVTDKDISAVSAINNGVMGLITPNVTATEKCFTAYYNKNTLVLTPEIIGHRGIPSQSQENSLEGAKRAFEVGATMVECDIYLMVDKNIVIMHDSTLDRTTNGSGKTAEQTAQSITKYQIDSKTGVAPEPIPLLKDFFEEFKGTDKVIVVELKSNDTNMGAPLSKLIKDYNMEKQVVIIAFSKDMIASIRKADPGISVNFLTSGITANESMSLEVAKTVLDNVIPINTAYSPSKSAGTLGTNLFRDLAARGVTVWNWTVNDRAEFNKYFLGGIRGITTNYVDWAGNYIKSFDAAVGENGLVTLTATNYKGKSADIINKQLVVIGGEGTFKDGVVTLSEGAEGFFFRTSCTTSSGTSYSVVTPVIPASAISAVAPEETTKAPDEETTSASEGVDTDGVATSTENAEQEGGCGSALALPVIVPVMLAGAFLAKKKEN